jgi:hypothetical protein
MHAHDDLGHEHHGHVQPLGQISVGPRPAIDRRRQMETQTHPPPRIRRPVRRPITSVTEGLRTKRQRVPTHEAAFDGGSGESIVGGGGRASGPDLLPPLSAERLGVTL